MEPLTSEQLLDVFAGVRRGELVDDVQGRLVVRVPDVHVNLGLRNRKYSNLCFLMVRGDSNPFALVANPSEDN